MYGMGLLRIYFIQINVKKTRLSLNLIVSFNPIIRADPKDLNFKKVYMIIHKRSGLLISKFAL